MDELSKEAKRIIAENPNEKVTRELWKQKAKYPERSIAVHFRWFKDFAAAVPNEKHEGCPECGQYYFEQQKLDQQRRDITRVWRDRIQTLINAWPNLCLEDQDEYRRKFDEASAIFERRMAKTNDTFAPRIVRDFGGPVLRSAAIPETYRCDDGSRTEAL